MHVGLNLVYLVPGDTGGTETYARQLIPELVAAAPTARFTAFINRETAKAGAGPWGELIPAVTIPVRAHNRLDWVRGEQELLPRRAAALGVDLVHSLANTAPAYGRFRRVVTIHDLNYRIVPEAHLGVRGLGMRVLVPLAARRSHRIITDSASTRRDLEHLLGVAPEKIDVVPLGLGAPGAGDTVSRSEMRAWLGAGELPIILSVSAKRPHKNLSRLIGALGLVDAAHRPLLVLCGYPTAHEDELRRRAEDLGLSNQVRFLDWVAPERLEGLYAAANGFIFPSLYEGFGLPVLEAMARGVPVACSGRGSLAEVAGDAALMFDPKSEADIARAIDRLIADGAETEHLREAGRRQASEFSWTRTANGTLASYERALSSPR